MASPLFVRGIGFNKYSTSNYALVFIYILNINAFDNRIKALITRKAYIVNNLKVKILIGINIMGLKSIDIFIIKKEVYIDSYKISALIKIKVKG